MNFPLYTLAPISWYVNAINSGEIFIFPDELFPKQTLRNRLVIPTANNMKSLSVPIDGKTKHEAYGKVMISYSENWVKQWLQTMATAYGKSPFYEFYGYRFEDVLKKEHTHIYALNIELLNLSLKMLKAEVEITEMTGRPDSEDFYQLENFDLPPFRQVFTERHGFQQDVSIADLIFNKGPNALDYLIQASKSS
ncbi:MAG: WbqC family protein [Bacteroidia bacterium]|nr:WbqC family protein [Bacteroidia bacterium]